MLIIVAVIPKTMLVAISAMLDEAEEDMLAGQLVRGDGAEEWDIALYQVKERL